MLRECGHRYQEASGGAPESICGGAGASPCGTFAIGVCVKCSQYVCGDHSELIKAGRHCSNCLEKRAARRAAASAEAAAQLEQARLQWLLDVPAVARRALVALQERGAAPFKMAKLQSRGGGFWRVLEELGSAWVVLYEPVQWSNDGDLRTGRVWVALQDDGRLVLMTSDVRSDPHLNPVRIRFGADQVRFEPGRNLPTPYLQLDFISKMLAYRENPKDNKSVIAYHLLADLEQVAASGMPMKSSSSIPVGNWH